MFSRYEFQKAVSETKTEYHSRGFSSWNHFVAMLFGQLSGQDSLRGIEAGLATQSKNLYHFGVKPIHRSTLSYANEHRSYELFQKTFYWMLSKCMLISPKHKFRFKNPLYSLDASLIHLCLSLYDWAKFRTTKGAVKLHLKLNHAGYLPAFCVLTTGKVPDQKIAPSVPFEKGDVVICDKGYTDFSWYKTLDDKGVYFVTRLKDNAHYKVTSRNKTDSLKNIYSDQVIKFKRSRKRFPNPLRRIRSKDQETGKIITILT
ncbi:MAG: IS4 family transposase, partial [Candidatus Omnitrophota bacterium]